jgi:GcrA cell cycle regulator
MIPAARRGPPPPSPWPERDAQLLRNAAEHLPASVIAERMGLTKGQVCGRLHRLHRRTNSERYNPDAEAERVAKIKASWTPQRRANHAAMLHKRLAGMKAAKTAPPLPPLNDGGAAAIAAALADGAQFAHGPGVPAPRSAPSAPPRVYRPGECCWPIGGPRSRGFRYCDAPTYQGLPYCADHAKSAYPAVRDRLARHAP